MILISLCWRFVRLVAYRGIYGGRCRPVSLAFQKDVHERVIDSAFHGGIDAGHGFACAAQAADIIFAAERRIS